MVEAEEIRTERLALSRIQPADADVFVAMHSSPAVFPHDGWEVRTLDQARALFDRFQQHWVTDGIGYWTIRLAGSAEVIGFGGVRHSVEEGEAVLNLSYRLWPSAWGRGYAPEMAGAALDLARRHRPDRPVVIVTDVGNTASIRVAEKLRFALALERHLDGRTELLFRLPPS